MWGPYAKRFHCQRKEHPSSLLHSCGMVQVLGSLTSFRCDTCADGTLCQESRLEGIHGITHSDIEVGRASVLKVRVKDITGSVLVVTLAALLGAGLRVGCPCVGRGIRCPAVHRGVEFGGHHDHNQGGGLRMDQAARHRHSLIFPMFRNSVLILCILYSKKFSSAKNFVKSDRRAVHQEFIFVKRRPLTKNLTTVLHLTLFKKTSRPSTSQPFCRARCTAIFAVFHRTNQQLIRL